MVKLLVGLSGENNPLPFEELKALIETYDPQASLVKLSDRLVLIEGNLSYEKIYKRASYIRIIGELIGSLNNDRIEWFVEENFLKGSTYRVSGFLLGKYNEDLEALVGEKVLKLNPLSRVSLENPDKVLWIVRVQDDFLLILSKKLEEKRWIDRRPRAKPFFHPSALYPKLARALVNLSRVREGEYFLDPFCGTGSLLIEAELIGINSVGMDINLKMCKGTKANLNHFKLKSDIINANSFFSPLIRVDAIATDIPYGRCASTYGKEQKIILSSFLEEFSEILGKGRYMVIMHRHELEFFRSEFELIQRCLIPVHRNLTRAISVMRRK